MRLKSEGKAVLKCVLMKKLLVKKECLDRQDPGEKKETLLGNERRKRREAREMGRKCGCRRKRGR
jgi:hypothetical protein